MRRKAAVRSGLPPLSCGQGGGPSEAGREQKAMLRSGIPPLSLSYGWDGGAIGGGKAVARSGLPPLSLSSGRAGEATRGGEETEGGREGRKA